MGYRIERLLESLYMISAARVLVVALAVAMSVCCTGCGGRSDDDSLLKGLDKVIANRDVYDEAKREEISRLHEAIGRTSTDEERFHAIGHLLDQYISYNSDSALVLCQRRMELAKTIDNPDIGIHARLSMAHVLSTMGFYKETIDILDNLAYDSIPEYLYPYYFHINRTVYGFLSDYTELPDDRRRYMEIADAYRDSMISINDEGSLYYSLILGDQLNVHGKADEAVKLLTAYSENNEMTEHERAILAFTLSQSYELVGDTDNRKRQLVLSAINDMKTGVNEYVALRELALLLYEEGDVKHAYDYLTICMEDAQECNARLRILEINDIFPIVNHVYLDTIRAQQSRLRWGLGLVCLLSVGLVLTLFWLYREKRKADRARQSVADMNTTLNGLNLSLRDANRQLTDANGKIIENSCLKEEFIAQYMGRCTVYIEKLDKYRMTVSKIAATGNKEELAKFAKSLSALDSEMKAFYRNFDETFLKLFPTFISDFNALLNPEEAIIPKTPGTLNTELRIFALIRLGISDSSKIAHFLRYSLATIYSYRTKVRNRARGDRDALEKQLLDIGRISR